MEKRLEVEREINMSMRRNYMKEVITIRQAFSIPATRILKKLSKD